MAGLPSSPSSDVHLPVRSISLPSRVHPTCVKFEAALNHLKAWKTSTETAVSSADTVQIGLVGLAELYNCVGEIIRSPQTQKTLVHYQKGKLVEGSLDESVIFLETCGKGRDLVSAMKENIQTLQSALRRRRGDSSSVETEVATYINLRKKIKKEVAKYLVSLKKLESKINTSTVVNINDMVVKALREASAITISVLQSLFLFLSMPSMKTTTKVGGWSKISKLIPTRLLSSEKEKVMNEVGSVDLAVYSINGGSIAELETLQRMLKTLDANIDGFDAGLDCIFKCLVQNRVTFLNIITHH